jgi:1,4-dihydroxy-2-naphthoyl-CoA hydrolase
MAFEHQTTVLFSQVDSVGIVFFARAFEYCHETLEAMLAAGGMPLHSILDGGDWAMPLVHAEADYKRPMRLGDRLTVRVDIEKLGPGSVTFAYTILSEGGETHATARLVHAVIDRQRFKARRVPDVALEAFRRAGLTVPE